MKKLKNLIVIGVAKIILKNTIWKYMYKLFMKKKENLFAKFAKKDLVYQEPYKNIQCCITNNFEIFFTEMPSYIFYLDEMIYLYNFSSKWNLKVNMENVHEGLKRFKCDKSAQIFTEKKH